MPFPKALQWGFQSLVRHAVADGVPSLLAAGGREQGLAHEAVDILKRGLVAEGSSRTRLV